MPKTNTYKGYKWTLCIYAYFYIIKSAITWPKNDLDAIFVTWQIHMTLVNLILVKSDLETLQRNKKIRIYHKRLIPSRYHIMIHSESFRIREFYPTEHLDPYLQ